ncbi:MAG: flagellar hook-length control protein FliK [Burkholderiaceae bacterium]|nr:MAG: flagellar hook-length control protein FliK [Burkholderiaceae bacterium]
MLPTGNLNTPLQSGSALTSATRLRMTTVDVVLAVADNHNDLPASTSQAPITAKVLAVSPQQGTLPQTNRIQVEIDGRTLWLSAARQPAVGSQILLRLTDPATLAATLNAPGSAGEAGQAAASNQTSSLPVTSAPSTAATAQSQSTTSVSPFGNLINQLLSRIDAQAEHPMQLPALWTSSTPNQGTRAQQNVAVNEASANAHLPAEKIASGMHQAVAKSGLFYESHLEAWVRNERPLEQIRQEPQAQISSTASNNSDSTAAVPDKLLPIMREQMQVLEQRQFTAQVEVWPRQTAQITIADERRANDSEEDATPSWRTQMKLHLPQLGEINATLRIQGHSVNLEIMAQQDDSARSLRTQMNELQQGLKNSGLELTQFNVQRSPPLQTGDGESETRSVRR